MPVAQFEVRVRLAIMEDAEPISILTAQLGYVVDIEALKSRLSIILEDPRCAVFVAVSSSRKVIGWIHATLVQLIESPFRAEIGGLIMNAQHLRQGIGKELLTAIINWARSNDAKEVSVRCNVKREEAHRFYEAQGFSNVKSQMVFRKSI